MWSVSMPDFSLLPGIILTSHQIFLERFPCFSKEMPELAGEEENKV